MAKLFADRLQILETKLENIHDNISLEERLTKLEQQVEETNAKITQIINEITPIITSHANALNALLGSTIRSSHDVPSAHATQQPND